MENKLMDYFNSFTEIDKEKVINSINDISVIKLSINDITKNKYNIKIYRHSTGSTIHFNDVPRINVKHDESGFDPINQVYLPKKITSIKIIKLQTTKNLNESI